MRFEPWWCARTVSTRSEPLRGQIGVDVVVIGGGFAGLHAALGLVERGAAVVLLEKSLCGGGMSGRSSGFLTPDSELELHQLLSRFGAEPAATLWQAAVNGVDLVVSTAQTHGFSCDLQAVESLFVGIGRHGAESVEAERVARTTLGYASRAYDAAGLNAIHPGVYSAGLRYGDTWTLDPFAYCQALRALLLKKGVPIYEDSQVLRLDGTTAITAHGSVTAKRVVIAANGLSPSVSARAFRKYSRVPTYLAISEPLHAREIAALFPEAPMQCWDNRWIYSYYRLTSDGRLLIGGGSLITTLIGHGTHTSRVIESTIAAFTRRFSRLDHVTFETYWSGLIDVTADLLPIAAANPEQPDVFYILGCAGLPWAAWCGADIARRIAGGAPDGLARLLDWDRKTVVPEGLQAMLGKPLPFAVNLLAAKSGVRFGR
jgi:gamma-glutamylputrescine oxidase